MSNRWGHDLVRRPLVFARRNRLGRLLTSHTSIVRPTNSCGSAMPASPAVIVEVMSLLTPSPEPEERRTTTPSLFPLSSVAELYSSFEQSVHSVIRRSPPPPLTDLPVEITLMVIDILVDQCPQRLSIGLYNNKKTAVQYHNSLGLLYTCRRFYVEVMISLFRKEKLEIWTQVTQGPRDFITTLFENFNFNIQRFTVRDDDDSIKAAVGFEVPARLNKADLIRVGALNVFIPHVVYECAGKSCIQSEVHYRTKLMMEGVLEAIRRLLETKFTGVNTLKLHLIGYSLPCAPPNTSTTPPMQMRVTNFPVQSIEIYDFREASDYLNHIAYNVEAEGGENGTVMGRSPGHGKLTELKRMIRFGVAGDPPSASTWYCRTSDE